MVFAVWARARPASRTSLADLEHALVSSVAFARSEPELLALRGQRSATGIRAGFLARYFEKLRYSSGPRERAGFYMFLEMAP